MNLPERSRVYQCHHFDSTRWDYFEPRDDDIIIATSYKAGTTWTQAILAHLLFPDGDFPAPPEVMSPWLDMRIVPLEVILNGLKQQQHRRFIKTHLPLDGVAYNEKLKYLYVTRDGRDVFMSLWNHYSNMTDEILMAFDTTPGRVGDEFPRAPEDIHEFWKSWVSKSWFDWEESGWPYWSHLSNVQSWWDYRHLPNIKLVHYNDLLADPRGTIGDMADYLEIDVKEEHWPQIVEAISFDGMKANSTLYAPGGGQFWKGGADTFINKGTNGRWRDVLSEDELAQYDAACEQALTPECRTWLEQGGPLA
ncbi:MAG: sulfotransferase domain-containing protein [Halieaceae bacterium]